ncbi:type II secretion system protein N [Thalassotalea atypica]|uniref:type II secretion system protein N n=1 Tax=Thalassotalea atypica TaxID=2054316 RepID=UPI0025722D09|nr:type II secretion system protein N [Thalassotalea atypica]
MKKVVTAVAVFIAVYTVFLVVNAPASILTYGAKLPKNIALHNFSGTLWQSHVERVDVDKFSVFDVNAQLSPLSLALLTPTVKVTFGGGLYEGPQGQGVISTDGERIDIIGAELEVAANTIAPFINSPIPVQAFGLIRANIERFDYQAGQCSNASGHVKWLNAALSAMGEQVELGQFDAELACVDNLLTLNIQPTNKLGLSFSGQLMKNGRLSGSGFIKPGAGFPSKLRELLSFLGKPDQQGRYRIHI